MTLRAALRLRAFCDRTDRAIPVDVLAVLAQHGIIVE